MADFGTKIFKYKQSSLCLSNWARIICRNRKRGLGIVVRVSCSFSEPLAVLWLLGNEGILCGHTGPGLMACMTPSQGPGARVGSHLENKLGKRVTLVQEILYTISRTHTVYRHCYYFSFSIGPFLSTFYWAIFADYIFFCCSHHCDQMLKM